MVLIMGISEKIRAWICYVTWVSLLLGNDHRLGPLLSLRHLRRLRGVLP